MLKDRNRLALTALMAISPKCAEKVFRERSAKRLEGLKAYQQYLQQGPER